MFDDIPIPKARAGKARYNLYRKGLTDKQLRTLAQAAKRSGLRDEASYLRLLLEEARAESRKDDVLKIMLALARVEEADSRINMRHNRYPDEDNGSQLFQLTRYMFDRLTALFPAAVPQLEGDTGFEDLSNSHPPQRENQIPDDTEISPFSDN
jgi:hypothetical protein